jgi:hypothetical protein
MPPAAKERSSNPLRLKIPPDYALYAVLGHLAHDCAKRIDQLMLRTPGIQEIDKVQFHYFARDNGPFAVGTAVKRSAQDNALLVTNRIDSKWATAREQARHRVERIAEGRVGKTSPKATLDGAKDAECLRRRPVPAGFTQAGFSGLD